MQASESENGCGSSAGCQTAEQVAVALSVRNLEARNFAAKRNALLRRVYQDDGMVPTREFLHYVEAACIDAYRAGWSHGRESTG